MRKMFERRESSDNSKRGRVIGKKLTEAVEDNGTFSNVSVVFGRSSLTGSDRYSKFLGSDISNNGHSRLAQDNVVSTRTAQSASRTKRSADKINMEELLYSQINRDQFHKLYSIYKIDMEMFGYDISPYDTYVRD